MRVHCAACGMNHNISTNLAGALIEAAQRGEMHTVGTAREHGRTYTQVYPRCILKMRHEIERSSRGGSDLSASPVAS